MYRGQLYSLPARDVFVWTLRRSGSVWTIDHDCSTFCSPRVLFKSYGPVHLTDPICSEEFLSRIPLTLQEQEVIEMSFDQDREKEIADREQEEMEDFKFDFYRLDYELERMEQAEREEQQHERFIYECNEIIVVDDDVDDDIIVVDEVWE